jgi:hypothetical protein
VSQGVVKDMRILDGGVSAKQRRRDVGMGQDRLAENGLGVRLQIVLPRLELVGGDGGGSTEARSTWMDELLISDEKHGRERREETNDLLAPRRVATGAGEAVFSFTTSVSTDLTGVETVDPMMAEWMLSG